MAGFGNFDISELKNLQKQLNKLAVSDTHKFMESCVKELAMRLLRSVKRMTPVDTGSLRRGWNANGNKGDGESLSQGQRQLLAIARAAVADPPVLILDEATSSIDTRTEALIEKGMDSLMKNRTVFVIAHRLSTVRNADMIIVLEHGTIIEQGTHEQLMEEQGRYYQLYTGAFQLD